MKRSFFYFAWKEFTRSSNLNKNLAAKATLIFLAIYFGSIALFWGFKLDNVLTEKYPNESLIHAFNLILPIYLGFDLVLRIMIQNLPTFGFQPFMLIPVKRKKVAGYMLKKSLLHFFNFLPFFFLIPFAFSAAIKNTAPVDFWIWLFSVCCMVFTNHYLSMILKWRTNESNTLFYSFLGFCIAVVGVDYLGWINVNQNLGNLFSLLSGNALYVVVFPALLMLMYMLNQRYILSRFYLDEMDQKKSENSTHDFSWLNRMGDYGKMLSLEVKMILRNKRPRQSAIMSVLFLFYGLLIYKDQAVKDSEFIFVLGGIFMTGIFSMTYGQFFPAWHSSYYPLLMSQNMKMKHVLQSAFFLMVATNMVFYLLSLGYVIITPKVIYIHLVAMLYNVGVNSWVIFALGLNNKKQININERATFNYQGMGATQWLIAFPIMFGPLIVYGILVLAFNHIVAYATLGGLGLLGIILHPRLINYFTKAYLKNKHLMIAGYKER